MKKQIGIVLIAILLFTMAPLRPIYAQANEEENTSSLMLDYDISVENVTVVRCVDDYQGVSGLCINGFLFNRGVEPVQIIKDQVTLNYGGKKMTEALYQEVSDQITAQLPTYFTDYAKQLEEQSGVKSLKTNESSFFTFLVATPSSKKKSTVKLTAKSDLLNETDEAVTDQNIKNNTAVETVWAVTSPDLAVQGLSAVPVIENNKITKYELSGYVLNLSPDQAIKDFKADVLINKKTPAVVTLDSAKGDFTFYNDAWFDSLSTVLGGDSEEFDPCTAQKAAYEKCVSDETSKCESISNKTAKQACVSGITVVCATAKTVYDNCVVENEGKDDNSNSALIELEELFADVLLPGSKAYFKTEIVIDELKKSANVIAVQASTTFTAAKLPAFPKVSNPPTVNDVKAVTAYVQSLIDVTWENSQDAFKRNNTSMVKSLFADYKKMVAQVKKLQEQAKKALDKAKKKAGVTDEDIQKAKDSGKKAIDDAKKNGKDTADKLKGKKGGNNSKPEDQPTEDNISIFISGKITDGDTGKPVPYAYASCTINVPPSGGMMVTANDKGEYEMEISKPKSEFKALECSSYKASSDYERIYNETVDLIGIKGGEKYEQNFVLKLAVSAEEKIYLTYVGFLQDKATGAGLEGAKVTCDAYGKEDKKISSGSTITGKDGYIDGQKIVVVAKNTYLTKYVCAPDPAPDGYKIAQIEGTINQNMAKDASYIIKLQLEK